MNTRDLELWFAKTQLGGRTRMRIYRKLSRLLRANVSLQMALDVLYDQASRNGQKPGHPEALAIGEWRKAFRDGQPLGRCLDGWAPSAERMLVESGEVGSNLADTLDNVVRINQAVGAMRGAMIGGLAYPGFLLAAVVFVLYVFGSQVIPAFSSILPPERWTGTAAQMHWMSGFVTSSGPYVLGVVIALVVAFIFAAPRWTGPVRSKLDHYPPFSLYRLVLGGGFLMSASALIHAGVSVAEMLRRLRRDANPWMRERIDAALRQVNSGANLGEALDRIGYGFPDREVVDDLRVFATLPGFDESLEMLGQQWLERGVDAVKAQAAILLQVAIVLLGLTVGWLVAGLFSIQQQVTQQTQMMGGGF